MGKRSRDIGHRWERTVARALGGKRNLEQTREGGCDVVDHGMPATIECKAGARPDIYGGIDQVVRATPPGNYSILFCCRSQGRGHTLTRFAVVPYEDMLEMLETLKATAW